LKAHQSSAIAIQAPLGIRFKIGVEVRNLEIKPTIVERSEKYIYYN
jgi:hypothetical protein